MDEHFDQLTRALAGSLSRRQALKRLGVGAGLALLALVGGGRSAYAACGGPCQTDKECPGTGCGCFKGTCQQYCNPAGGSCPYRFHDGTALPNDGCCAGTYCKDGICVT